VIIHLHIWTGHILCRNCLLKHIIDRKIEERTDVTGRLRRRHKQLLDDLKEMTGYRKLKEKALDRILWRTLFGRDYRPVKRHPTEQMKPLTAHMFMPWREKLPFFIKQETTWDPEQV
jgi:hypothetical protein